jgi:hypothetical protein
MMILIGDASATYGSGTEGAICGGARKERAHGVVSWKKEAEG